MNTIKIVNLKTYKPNPSSNETLIKIDRTSILGNPFYMSNESERNLVCDEYRLYFCEQMEVSVGFRSAVCDIIRELEKRDIVLGCWCYPKRCHGEIIKEYIESVRI